MPSTIGSVTDAGYQKLRDFIQANWKYISFVDSSDAEIMRLQIGVDVRVTWTHAVNANPIEATANLKGSDAEILEPCTFNKMYLYDVATGGDRLAGGLYTIATIESDDDTLQLKLQIQEPALV